MSAKTAEGGWAADTIALSLASARLAGALTVGADDLATGELSFGATNLDDLSPLVLTKMSGALQAKVSASAADGKQALAAVAQQRPDGVRDQPPRWPQGRPENWRPVARARHFRPSHALAGGNRRAIRLRHPARRQGPGRFHRPCPRRRRARPRRESPGTPVGRRADQAGPRPIYRAGRRPHDRPRGTGDADLRQGWACDPELRPARRFGPPRPLGPSGPDARSPRERDRDAAGRARSRLARPRPFRNRRRRRDDPGRAGRSRRRLAASPATSQRAADAEQRVAAARRRQPPAGLPAGEPRSTSQRTRAPAIPSASPDRRRCRATARSISRSTGGSTPASPTTPCLSPGAA